MKACNSTFTIGFHLAAMLCGPTGGGVMIRHPKVKQKPIKAGSQTRGLKKLKFYLNNNIKKAEIAPTR